MQMMDAIVKPVAGPGLELRKVPVPVPGPGEVLIKVHKTAICGTDVHIYNWDPWAQEHIKAPMTIGHEYVGEVAALGAGVTGPMLALKIVDTWLGTEFSNEARHQRRIDKMMAYEG